MAESQALEQLEQIALDEGKRNARESRGIHEFLEVLVQKFKNQIKLIFCVDDIQQLDDIRVIKFLKERDLSDGSTGYTFSLTWRGWENRDKNTVTNIILSGIHNPQPP